MRTTISSYRGEQFTLVGTVDRGAALVTADVAQGAAVIPLDSTDGYPTAGSVFVGGSVVAYSGVTATSLTGCTGTPAIQAGTIAPYAVDLRLASTALKFEAKRARDDAAALVTKQTSGNGVTVPGTAPGHTYNIAIAATDTSVFVKTEELVWGLWLTEPNADVTLIADGDWRVALGASG